MADSTSGSWNAAAFLFTIFLCSPETETANITVIRPKSLSTGTLYAVEGKNLTLEWFYTILGTVGASKFAIVNADGREQVIGKGFSPGAMNVTPRYQERFKVEATDTRAELTILAVQRSDEKRYELNILPTGDGSILENWVVVVNVPPNITEISENQTVIEGGNVTLKCVADGKPTPNITWTIFSDNSVVNMTLTDIGRQDAGKYKCTADNGIGSAAIGDVWIVVQYPVEAKEFGVNKTVGQGGKTTLSCPVDGIPKPNITWYRGNDANGSPIFIGPGVKLEAREGGCYTCVASNSLGIPVSITQCLTVEESSTSAPGLSRTVIGFVTAVGVAVFIVIVLVTCWVCKKKKCGKNPKRTGVVNEVDQSKIMFAGGELEVVQVDQRNNGGPQSIAVSICCLKPTVIQTVNNDLMK